MGYKSHVFKGVSWMWALRIAIRGITFIRLGILARLLTPLQFGVFGIATLVLSFLEILTETGINVFLIQEKNAIKEYLNSAWIVSIARGCLIAVLLIVTSPLIATFFHSPESQRIIVLIAIVPFVRGFINPSIIFIQKEIQFQKEFLLRFFLFFVDALVSISAAFITRSVESFAYGLIVSAFAEVFLSYAFFNTKPKLILEINKIKKIIRRGFWITTTGIFLYFADNGDNIMVGRLLGASPLGFYQIAYKLSTLPITEITDAVNKVVFPVYSKFSEDIERLTKAFLKVTIISTIFASILCLIIFFFAEELIRILLGSQWISAVGAVRVLAIYGVLRTIFGNFAPLALAMKKQDFIAKSTLVRLLALSLLIVPLTTRYGLVGAGFAVFFSMFFEIALILYYLRKIFLILPQKGEEEK